MINDFKACGGIVMLATGFRIARIKQFPITDMLPAMILAMDYLYYAFAVKLNRIKNAQCGRLQEIAAGRTSFIDQYISETAVTLAGSGSAKTLLLRRKSLDFSGLFLFLRCAGKPAAMPAGKGAAILGETSFRRKEAAALPNLNFFCFNFVQRTC